MKNIFPVIIIALFGACNNDAGKTKDGVIDSNASIQTTGTNDTSNSAVPTNEADAPNNKTGTTMSSSSGGNCGNSVLFHKGTEMETSTYNGQGKLMSKNASFVASVNEVGGMTVAEMEIVNDTSNVPGRTNNAIKKNIHVFYKCDGKKLYVDLSSFIPGANKPDGSTQTSGIEFPFKVTVGESLPNADYSIDMNRGGKSMKITSHITERKVEAKETITTTAGSFDCYKISSVIEASMEFPGMDEKSKEMMKNVKDAMGKSRMIWWYAPDITIIKTEFYMGEKLVTRTEITGLKK